MNKTSLEKYKNAWLGLGDTTKLVIKNNPLLDIGENPSLDVCRIMRNPKYWGFLCKHMLGIQLHPIQLACLQVIEEHPFPMLIASRGFGKTTLLAIYSLIKCLTKPGTKIVCAGAAFRQSKFVFEHMETIWNKSPILRSVCDNSSGPQRETDRCTMHINDSWMTALPIGDGSKIRGMRAHIILAEEFNAIRPDIYETVLSGFTAVSSDPIENAKLYAARQEMIKDGVWTDIQEEEFMSRRGNQSIISGTAGFDFEHFADYWRRYKAIIETKGNIRELKDILKGDIPLGFNWRDYTIIRYPYELIPPGFMDEKQVARSRATIHSGIYANEYGACITDDVEIITNCGIKEYKNIDIGDLVLTHNGRFRKVIKKTYRKYDDKIIDIQTYGFNKSIRITPEHPILENGGWIELNNIKNGELSNLKELNNKKFIDLIQYSQVECLPRFVDNIEYIYRSGGKLNINYEICNNINNKQTTSQLRKNYKINYNNIYKARDNINKRSKFSIPRYIPLDYHFGLICGYYASEGNISSAGRSVEFSLDGHKDQKLQIFIEELLTAIKTLFNIQAKSYFRKECNTQRIIINNVILASVIKTICPGIASTKYILPEILYSNDEFLKGFIKGYWNGDGHKNEKFGSANSCSKNLLSQIRVALSYFNISSSLNNIKNKKDSIFRNKIYKTKQAYTLLIHGIEYNKFLSLFYNKTINNTKSKLIYNNNNSTILSIVNKKIYNYNGYVYNLEIEEDNSYSLGNMTVHNCFSRDSNGFFKRSLIDSCIASDIRPIKLASGEIWFDAVVRGNSESRYVFGIDPAADKDNFTIVILELKPDHHRVVYAWSTNRKSFQEKQKLGLTSEQDYYGFCARKIRDLVKLFPPERIGMDGQGGGVAVEEALHDTSTLKGGESPIWRAIDSDHPRHSDNIAGSHILEIVQFAKADWVSEANHGLRKDMEDKTLLFPRFDSLTLELSYSEDKRNISGGNTDRIYDSLEDCVFEIEELKNELSSIIMTKSTGGTRDRWDTPEVKGQGGKRERLRKDRYSSLLIANMLARQIKRAIPDTVYEVVGRASHNVTKEDKESGEMYKGTQWYKPDSDIFIGIIK